MSAAKNSRDLKPGNCLLSIGRGPIPKVLVGDFGEGHVEGSGKVGTGTIEYTAPELLNRELRTIRHAYIRDSEQSCSLNEGGHVLTWHDGTFYGIQRKTSVYCYW